MPPRFSISELRARPGGAKFFTGFQPRAHARGTLICTGAEDENGVFLVSSGRLRAYMIGEEREITLFYLAPGDLFCTHSGCLVEAVEPAETRFADIETFRAMMEDSPSVSFGLVSILGRAILSCMRTIEDLMFRDIVQRLAVFFLDHAQTEGRTVADGTLIALGLTTEEIASMIGAARQTTSTALNSLIKDGYLRRLSRTEFLLVDPAGLQALAAGEEVRKALRNLKSEIS